MVRAGDRAADQQEVPAAGGGYQRPAGVPGPLGAISVRTALEDRIAQGLLCLDHLPRGRAIRKSRGAISAYGRPRSSHASRSLLLRV